MPASQTIDLMSAYIDAINAEDLPRLEGVLAPNVVLREAPHRVHFPGNVIARLRAERAAFPDLHMEVENLFADEDGGHGALVVLWTGRRLKARICMLFEVVDNRIATIELYGGLMKVLYDVGLLKVA